MTPSADSCVHHWKIAAPHGGPTSAGRCRKCGERREFPNSAEYMAWTQDNRKAAARGNAASKTTGGRPRKAAGLAGLMESES